MSKKAGDNHEKMERRSFKDFLEHSKHLLTSSDSGPLRFPCSSALPHRKTVLFCSLYQVLMSWTWTFFEISKAWTNAIAKCQWLILFLLFLRRNFDIWCLHIPIDDWKRTSFPGPFQGLAVDLIFSITQRHHTREFFSSCDHAFRIVEVELNFLYDVLFTKLPVVYHRFGFSCHAVSFLAIVTSLVLFHYADKKHLRLEGFEVGITYTLLIGGIVLEVIAFFMLVFSDWTVVKIKPSPDHENPRYNPNEQSWECMFSNFILSVNVRRRKIICWLLNIGGVRGRGKDCVSKPTTGSRWEESISGYNFIYYCLHRRSGGKETFFDQFGVTAFFDKIVYVKQHPLPSYMKQFIFQELKMKSEMAYDLDQAKQICSARGEWVLKNEGYSSSHDLSRYLAYVEYDESLLLWHIATEIWFTNDKREYIDGEQDHRRISKLISDYMIYLLVMKSGMMSAVSRIGLIRFRYTFAVARSFLDKSSSIMEGLPEVESHRIVCEELLNFQPGKLASTTEEDRGLMFSTIQRDQSREFFSSCHHAFRIVEVELNFLYDVLFTKLPVVYHRFGFSCRAVSFLAIVASLVLFHYADKKHLKLEGFEVGITYTLLIGGIVLEVIAFFMLVFSDWTVVKIKPSPDLENPRYNPNEQSWECMFSNYILSANVRSRKIICWLLNIGGVRGRGKDFVSKPTAGSRWAESISGYNLIYYCLHRRSGANETFLDQFGITAFLEKIVCVKLHPLPSYMKEFIFKELKTKSEMASDLDTAKKIGSARGEWVLRTEGYSDSDLSLYVADVEYDESLLVWHIATEIWFPYDKRENIDGEQEHTRIAKLISDYMIYLLVMKPGMMSAVSRIGLIRFRDTCAEAKKFSDIDCSIMEGLPEVESHSSFCEQLLNYRPSSGEFRTNKNRGMSILLKAAELAKVLGMIEPYERWELMSKMWVELLSYGAIHIRPNAHAQQLSKGGELVTIVWLLMTQLGLGDQFQPHFGF
ncbi:hypothetical protein ACET3Z_006263 [Daucus carota]